MASVTDGNTAEDRSTGDLVKSLAQDMAALVRQEMELAKAEMMKKGRRFGVGAGAFGAGGVIGLMAFAALTACFILALNEILPAAVAALIVAIAYGAVAAMLFVTGKDKVQEATPPVPEQAVESVKEDVEWLKNPTRSESG